MSRDALQRLRDELDAIDDRIVDEIAQRQRVISGLAAAKADAAAPLYDPAREEAHLAHLSALAQKRGLSGYLVRRVFRELFEHALRSQQHHVLDQQNAQRKQAKRAVVAFQGADGAYSQIAAEQHFGGWQGEIETRGCDSFLAMLEAVAHGDADYGMLPVENTTAGSINEAYDLLAQTTLSVVGEEVLRVEHCLVGLPGSKLEQIRRVYSHPQALAQCSTFLAGLRDCAVLAFTDTAMSVKKVRDEGDESQAAIASERAAKLYGLEVVARNVESQKDNFTRFMVVARSPLQLDERIPCKTSLIFSTRHEQGALVRCLNVLADRGLNLTKLESRPRLQSPFEYIFYVDFEGNLESEPVKQALAAMRAHTSFLKVLGSYPSRAPRPLA
ncbi:MAG: prephenate dehydratase [Polyangiales bacterium]